MNCMLVYYGLESKLKNFLFKLSIVFLIAAHLLGCDRRSDLIVDDLKNNARMLGEGEVYFFKKQGVKKICIQPPYVEEQDYKDAVAGDYKFIPLDNDAQFRIHIFFSDGGYEQALVKDKYIRIGRIGKINVCGEMDGAVSLKKQGNFVILNIG